MILFNDRIEEVSKDFVGLGVGGVDPDAGVKVLDTCE